MAGLYLTLLCNILVLLISTMDVSKAFLEDEVVVSLKAFQLSYSPSHVVNHVTRDVSLRCAHVVHSRSKLGSVTRIRVLKKSPEVSKWQLVAEQRDTEDGPTTMLDIPVSGRIDQHNVAETFLEVTWPVAGEDTFGTYRCDVLGFRWNSEDMEVEVSPQVDIVEEDVNNGDLHLLYGQIKIEMSHVKINSGHINEKIESLNGKCISLTTEINRQEEQIESFTEQFDEVDKFINYTKTEIDAEQRKVGSLDLETELLNQTLSAMTEKVIILEGQFASTDHEIHSIKKNVGSVSEDVKALKAETSSLQEDMQSVNTSVGTASELLLEATVELDSTRQDVKSTSVTVTTLNSEVLKISGDTPSLSDELESVKKQVTFIAESLSGYQTSIDMVNKLYSWPGGQFALLQPTTGCPVDLTFSGQGERYLKIHTESIGETNYNEAPGILGHYASTEESKGNFITLKFCEANGIFNTKLWPRGSYCINDLKGNWNRPTCPMGFSKGFLRISADPNFIPISERYIEYTSRSVQKGQDPTLHFCCRSDGSHSQSMVLPTDKPFVLYRYNGQCQSVEGMDVTEETLLIDTDNEQNNDATEFSVPDVEVYPSKTDPLRMYLCHYTRV